MKLDELCEIVRGSSPRPKDDKRYYGGTVPRLMVADLTRDGKFVTPKIDFLTDEGSKKSRPMKKGDVVIAVSGNPGLPAILNIDACIHDGFVGLKNLDNSKISVDFLYRFLVFSKDATNFGAVGAIFKNLTTDQIREINVPLPPLAEQKRIAEVLDKADALREKRRRALQKLDTLLQSVFLEMFGDPVKNPKGWTKKKMGDLMLIRRGGSPRPIEDYLGGEFNWIKIGDATKGNDIYLESCKDKIIKEGLKKTVFLKAGSLIFANCGVSLGFARILKIDGCIHDGWLSFENIPDEKLNKIFLLKALNNITNHFRSIAPSGTQPNLNTGIMKDFKIIVPPIDLQKKFASSVEKIENLRNRKLRSSEKIEHLFQSLQQKAFKGELFGGDSADELNDVKKVWQQTSLF